MKMKKRSCDYGSMDGMMRCLMAGIGHFELLFGNGMVVRAAQPQGITTYVAHVIAVLILNLSEA